MDIVWRPFELRPEPQPPPPQEYIDRAWRNSVQPLAERLGVIMRRPAVMPRTRLAHEAVAFAARQGHMGEMADAVFRAYWQDGRDIGQVAVLCETAAAVGLDAAALQACLEQRSLQAEVGEQLALGRKLGIQAVPTFVVGGRYLLQGLVDVEDLQQAVRLCRGEG